MLKNSSASNVSDAIFKNADYFEGEHFASH